MNTFFTSDTHFGHGNIMKYCGRTEFMTLQDKKLYEFYLTQSEQEQKKFKLSEESVNKMDKELIKRWNERVKPDDLVIFVGDFCFKRSSEAPEGNVFQYYRQQLNGEIIFIKGNHDKNNGIKSKIISLTIEIGKRPIKIVHNPRFADAKYSINLVGHVHKNWKIQRIRQGFSFTDCINVGVDAWNYRPVTYSEIMNRYNQWLRKK